MHGKAFLALSFLALLVATSTVATGAEEERPTNTIRAIRAVARGIEIEVHSTRPFPARALPAVLRIGDETFLRSRYAKGRLDTLIFLLSNEEFEALSTGDAVAVQYGEGRVANPRTTWDFGSLDKRRLWEKGSGS